MRTCYRPAEHGLAPFREAVTVLAADRIVLVINSGVVPGDDVVPGDAGIG